MKITLKLKLLLGVLNFFKVKVYILLIKKFNVNVFKIELQNTIDKKANSDENAFSN